MPDSQKFSRISAKSFFLIVLHLELPSDQENKNGFADERCGFLHIREIK